MRAFLSCPSIGFGKSDGQNLAAAGTARLQNVAACAGLHAGAEAMNLGTLTLLGLVSTEHCEQRLQS